MLDLKQKEKIKIKVCLYNEKAYWFEQGQTGQVKKKGKKAETEITTSESAVKKQEEFEEMKKKTGNMLLGLVAVSVLVIAGTAAYKAMH